MSIFDFLSKPLVDDPEQNKALMNGLLQAGLSLLSSKGNLGNALGHAGMQGLQGAQQYRDQLYQGQLRQSQLEEIKRKKAIQALPAQFMRPGVKPSYMDDRDVGQPGEQPIPAKQFDYGGYADALASHDPVAAIQLRAALQKDDKPIISKPGDVARDATGRLLWQNPEDAAKEPEAIRALKTVYGDGTPAYKAALQKYGDKVASHSPGVSVSYGAPVAGVDPAGNPVFFQPGKDGRAPAIVPGVRPAKDPRDKDLTESQAKATAFLGQMQSASKELAGIGADQTALSMQAETALAGGPVNIAIGQKAQRVRQAQDQWSEAFLRFKTGAASTPAEVKSNRETFFPKIGDGKDVIEQKIRMRAQAEADMAIAAGRGASKLDGRESPTRQVKRTGTANGRKVVEYSDGSIEYAD